MLRVSTLNAKPETLPIPYTLNLTKPFLLQNQLQMTFPWGHTCLGTRSPKYSMYDVHM